MGAARDCLETAISYARDRKVFDKSLAAYQITQAKIAPLRTSAELGDKVLADYRITLTETSKAMMICEREAATALTPASRSSAIATASVSVPSNKTSIPTGLRTRLKRFATRSPASWIFSHRAQKTWSPF